MKKVIAVIMIILVASTSVFCVTASAAQTNSQTAALGDGYGNYRSNTAVYQDLYHTIQDSGANGYAIVHIAGSSNYQLLLSYGKCEMDRFYEVFTINANSLSYRGQLGGAHTTAYIDTQTHTLGMYDAHVGCCNYGLVRLDGGLRVDYNHPSRVPAGQSYPSIPGVALCFYSTNNFAGIANF